ncbi:MAG: HAMP domain-containing sensor histidine kinase [Bacteroidota bacterium]
MDTNELIAFTAHDLRNIIARIYGLNSIVKEKLRGLPDKEAQKMTDLITSQCQHGLALTEGLVHTYKLSICSLTALLNKQITLYRYQAEKKGIELTADIPKSEIYVETRIVPLIRVLDNLFDNAVKFTPRCGSIKITLIQTDNRAVISFSDSGIGIPESFQPLLFEKNEQTQRLGTENEPSTGLGLYINKQLTKELKGEIWYESPENSGATFYISFDSRDNF